MIIEVVFPIILIVAGLALSTIVVTYNGVQREMSPSIYNLPNNLMYNLGGTVDGSNTQNFISQYFSDPTMWKL